MTAIRAMNAHVCSCLIVLLAAGTAVAQDSVSNNDTCLLGDAVLPWDTAEQVNDYVVDMTPFTTSWGTTFGIAPIAKSSKTSSTFYSSLTSASSISRLHIPTALSGTYDLWTTAGQGVNDDAAVNDPPAGSVDTAGLSGFQFGFVLAEFSTTDALTNYNGVLGGIVQYDDADPTRLYVKRVMAASNTCDGTNDLAQSGVGTVDASGNLHFRVDGFGTAGGGSSCTPALTEYTADGFTRIFRVNVLDRASSALNVLSDDYPGGLFDAGATDLVIGDFDSTLSTPNILPEEVRGNEPLYLGATFDTRWAREVTPGTVNADGTHLAAGTGDHRGTAAYSTATCSDILGDTHGIGAVIAKKAGTSCGSSECNFIMNIFGLDVDGNPVDALALELPAVITDPTNGETNFVGDNELDHYGSQVAFRGGNSQIAIGNTPDGNLVVAAQVAAPSDAGDDNPVGHIAVARVNCSTGNVDWTLAGYSIGPNTNLGKPILDGPGGNVIGHMTGLFNVTGGTPFGPSFSAPAIDSAGNVWFLSAIDLLPLGSEPLTSGLIRAVYNPLDHSYELELVTGLGSVFTGQNSGLDYLITFWAIADVNSVDSGTLWSSNISETAHLNGDPSLCSRGDPETFGGLVIAANIIYDSDQDGEFVACGSLNSNSVASTDEEYNVLLYFGSVSDTPCTPLVVPDPVTVPAGEPGSRYLRFEAPPSGVAGTTEEVVRVRMTSLEGFPTPTPDILYVGLPFDAPDEDSSQPGLTFRAAPLSCEPMFHTWSAEGVVSIYGAEIVPQSAYEIQRADTSCADLSDESCWSTPVAFTTGKHADMAAPFEDGGGPNPVQPDFADINGDVQKFLAVPGAPIKALAQLQPNVVFPLRAVDFKDIADAVDSFLGVSYASQYSGPCTCPATVTCGATACSGDTECAPGFCIGGACTDECGRCAP